MSNTLSTEMIKIGEEIYSKMEKELKEAIKEENHYKDVRIEAHYKSRIFKFNDKYYKVAYLFNHGIDAKIYAAISDSLDAFDPNKSNTAARKSVIFDDNGNIEKINSFGPHETEFNVFHSETDPAKLQYKEKKPILVEYYVNGQQITKDEFDKTTLDKTMSIPAQIDRLTGDNMGKRLSGKEQDKSLV